jgi:flagellin-like hook-associated protein FlgL
MSETLPAGSLTVDQRTEQEEIKGYIGTNKKIVEVGNGTGAYFNAYSLAKAINENAASSFWAMMDKDDDGMVYIFSKKGGDYNDLLACEVTDTDSVSRSLADYASFLHIETNLKNESGTTFSLGTTAADAWGRMKAIQSQSDRGTEVWNVTLDGRDVGGLRNIRIAAGNEIMLPGIAKSLGYDYNYDTIINGMDRNSFAEVQNAIDAPWAGAEIRTQESAQRALEAIDRAIEQKDKIRATLGAYQARLENTISSMEIQAENLQAAESRISDVDVAKEVTEMTKNSVLVQAATSMVAQANSMNRLALTLLGM